jgi:P-type conjugative transfer ATPase TrbB
MYQQKLDSLRHLEKDMGDILTLLKDPDINEIILNPFKRLDGIVEGHILIEKSNCEINNYTTTIYDSKFMPELLENDLLIVKYDINHNIDCWIKFDNNLNIEDLIFLVLSKIDFINNKIVQITNSFYINIALNLVILEEYEINSDIEKIIEYLNCQVKSKDDCYFKMEIISEKNKDRYYYPSLFEKIQLIKMTATKAETIMSVLASITGKFIHNKSPFLECQIPKYGHRFTGVIPPVSIFPAFCIRKHNIRNYTLDDFVVQGVMERSTCETIKSWIKRKFNILIAGGTGSGKTTLANAILDQITNQFPNERMLIIEDVPELQFNTSRSIGFTTNEFFSMYEALRTTLRFKPNRIIMGEIRGSEAYTLLKAWNTGHPGGLATIHANGVEEAIYRFENCVLDFEGARVNRKEIGFTINGIISIQNVTIKDYLQNGQFTNHVKRKVTALRQILEYDIDKDIYHDITYDKFEHSFE